MANVMIKSGLAVLIIMLTVAPSHGQTIAADITGIWVIKKSSTISVSGGQVLKQEGLHMLDTLNFNADGTFLFILTPQQGSLEKRIESGSWQVSDAGLILYNRRNQIGQELPKEKLSIRLKGTRKLRIYFNIGGLAQEHYEQFSRLKNRS